jgi:hypothetical protein
MAAIPFFHHHIIMRNIDPEEETIAIRECQAAINDLIPKKIEEGLSDEDSVAYARIFGRAFDRAFLNRFEPEQPREIFNQIRDLALNENHEGLALLNFGPFGAPAPEPT